MNHAIFCNETGRYLADVSEYGLLWKKCAVRMNRNIAERLLNDARDTGYDVGDLEIVKLVPLPATEQVPPPMPLTATEQVPPPIAAEQRTRLKVLVDQIAYCAFMNGDFSAEARLDLIRTEIELFEKRNKVGIRNLADHIERTTR